jgi:two-component system, chemotaxis family, sensor kinase Cph1
MQNFSLQLTECDKEPIQFIESIQPFGTLLAVDSEQVIVYAAVGQDFEWKADELLGKHIDTVLQDSERVSAGAVGRTEPTIPLLIRDQQSKVWMSCIVHKQEDFLIIELELVPPEPIDIASLKFVSDRRESLDSYLSFIAENIRAVTGYDRVMVYKFGLDWHGEVVAESLNSIRHSFMGHHFPASDIPMPARTLFTKMWVRIIADVDTTAVNLTSKSAKQLDLSRSVLRAASPIHLEYLRNMNVAGSLTMSLICDGKLWGLIACHHFSPKYLVAEERAICALLAKVVSLRITNLSVLATAAATDRIAAVSKALSEKLIAGNFIESVREHKQNLFQFLKADGFSFIAADSSIVIEGHAPSFEDLGELVKVLHESKLDLVYSESIDKSFPDLKILRHAAPGVLAIKVANNWLIWNRQEIVRSVLWAGNPNKPIYSDRKSALLNPRLSFESWKENVRGTAVAWEQYEIAAAENLRRMLAESMDTKTVASLAVANGYLKTIRISIDAEAADLRKQFENPSFDGLDL